MPDLIRSGLLRALLERHRDPIRAGAAAADVDLEFGVEPSAFDRQVCHADGLLQVWRLRAARDVARLDTTRVGVVAVACAAFVEHLGADDLPADAVRLLLAQ